MVTVFAPRNISSHSDGLLPHGPRQGPGTETPFESDLEMTLKP